MLLPGRVVTKDELVEFCVSQIARFKRPRIVIFVDSLPKTAIGKIQKNKLREPYWADHQKKSNPDISPVRRALAWSLIA